MRPAMVALSLLLVASTSFVVAQEIGFTATAEPSEVTLDQNFQVSFQLENAKGEKFTPPIFKGFEIVSGPNLQSQMVMINGHLKQSQTYSFFLKPLKKGVFKIGEATVQVKGKLLKTQPFTVEVKDKKNNTFAPSSRLKFSPDDGQEVVFIKAVLDKDNIYVGEQVTLRFVLFTRTDILKFDLRSMPDFLGTDMKRIRYDDTPNKIVSIGGKAYNSRVLATFALFPQKEGRVLIEPIEIEIFTLNTEGFPVRSQVASLPISLWVKPLPLAMPEFSGAVGDFSMKVTLLKNQITTDESVVLQAEITGDGYLKTVQFPFLDSLRRDFNVYEPTAQTNDFEQDSRIWGTKIFNYTLVPKQKGTYRIAPNLVFFDTKKQKFETIKSIEQTLRVTEGNATPVENSTFSDIRPLKTGRSVRSHRWDGALYGALVFLPFLIMSLVVYQKRYQLAQNQISPAERRRRQAELNVKKRLQMAQKHLQAQNNRAFYDEIIRAIWEYIADKTMLPKAELSTENIRQKLLENGLSQGTVQQVEQVLEICQVALFAGVQGTEDMETTYKTTTQVLTDMEVAFDGYSKRTPLFSAFKVK